MKWNSETESQTVKEKAGTEECRRETRNEINYPTTVQNNNKMQQRKTPFGKSVILAK